MTNTCKVLIILMFFPIVLIGQTSDSYFPVDIGKKKTLTWYDLEYVEYFTDTVKIDGYKYHMYSQKFKGHFKDKAFRVSNDTVYFWNEVRHKHQVYFGINPIVGEKIGLGTIKQIDATLETG